MFSRRLKTGYFALEGMNSFATVYYFYYFYFYMQKSFGFDNKASLALAALSGGVYAVFSLWAGRFAQRFGYFTALKLGFATMMASLLLGLQLHSAAGEIGVMVTTVMGMCFTWPTLEALVSEGEPAGGVQHMVGLYNIVWAGTAAVANFSGGAMLEKLGPGSLFYVPVAIQACQLGLTFWLEAQARRSLRASRDTLAPVAVPSPPLEERARERRPAPLVSTPDSSILQPAGALPPSPAVVGGLLSPPLSSKGGEGEAPARCLALPDAWKAQRSRAEQLNARAGQPAHPGVAIVAELPAPGDGRAPSRPVRAASFLRMAWLANPFAYIAINTIVATMPAVAGRLKLSTMLAGFCCSVWCFARLGAFLGLWLWNGWHYRFRWLLLSYLTLIGSFAAILLTRSLTLLVLAQLAFGGGIGLIYYSSLFYSMDQSDTKGEHGGIHEAAIGLGNFAGPALGAAALQFVPQSPNSGAVAVTLLLLAGLGALCCLRIPKG